MKSKKVYCDICDSDEFKTFFNIDMNELGKFCINCGEEYPYNFSNQNEDDLYD